MDAIEFIKARARMCAAYSGCDECPIQNHDCFASWHVDVEQMVDTVDKWSKEHPIMTNRMKFEEVFGCDMSCIPEMSSSGWVSINSITLPNSIFTKEWWNAEYEGGKGGM